MTNAFLVADSIYFFIQEHIPASLHSWPKQEFIKRSYERWAAYELANEIMDNPLEDPFIIIENFIVRMAMFSCIGRDKERSYMFSVAVEVAENFSNALIN